MPHVRKPKLTEEQRRILRYAMAHGSYRPGTKARVDDCLALLGRELLTENDNAPGVYEITEAGEAAAEALMLVA